MPKMLRTLDFRALQLKACTMYGKHPSDQGLYPDDGGRVIAVMKADAEVFGIP